MFLKSLSSGAGGMARQLGALDAFAEGLYLVFNIHVVAHNLL